MQTNTSMSFPKKKNGNQQQKPQQRAVARPVVNGKVVAPATPVNQPVQQQPVEQINTVHNSNQNFQQADPVRPMNPEATSVALPSNFLFYPFKDIYLSPMRAVHLSKIARSKEEQNMHHMVEALSGTLTTTDPRFQGVSLAHMLTIEDFFWCLYFHRLESFNNIKYLHTTACTNKEHRDRVISGELEEKTLIIEQLVTKSEIRNTNLEAVPTYDQQLMGDIRLAPGFMSAVLEVHDLPEEQVRDNKFIIDLAMFMDAPNLKTKMEIANNLSPAQILEVRKYAKAVSAYGIDERVNVKCRVCGASKDSSISFDASAFLPG